MFGKVVRYLHFQGFPCKGGEAFIYSCNNLYMQPVNKYPSSLQKMCLMQVHALSFITIIMAVLEGIITIKSKG